MKTIYIIHLESEECGEVQGLFDADRKLVDFWSDNDANWRSEYFAGILKHLGAEEKRPTAKQRSAMERLLEAACKEAWD